MIRAFVRSVLVAGLLVASVAATPAPAMAESRCNQPEPPPSCNPDPGPPPSDHAPLGAFDTLSYNAGTASISGWTLDVNGGPNSVHVYADGRFAGAFAADQYRADIGARFPSMGPYHGFSGSVPVSSAMGTHEVCVYAINWPDGTVPVAGNPRLGCKQYDVKPAAPSNLRLYAGSRNVLIFWTDNATDETDYEVTVSWNYSCNDPSGHFPPSGSQCPFMTRVRTGPFGGGEVSYNYGLLPRVTYVWVTVRAWSGTAYSTAIEAGVMTLA